MMRGCVVILLPVLAVAAGCGDPGARPAPAPQVAEAPEEAAKPPTPEAAKPEAPQPESPKPPQPETPKTDAPVAAAPAKLGPVHKLSVLDLDGKSVSLAQFAGRPMIIEIWATWCGPCRVNRNTIHKLRPEFPERLLVISVSLDTPGPGGSPAQLVRDFLRSNIANDHEFLATPEFLEFVNQRASSNSIPKTMYVNGRGQCVDLSEGVQGKDWLRGMAKNLK